MSVSLRLELPDLIRLKAAARGIELGARRRILSAQAGGYLSAYRGRGLEFDEVRAYQPGDDARTIDWRVTARRGMPHTKLFREERDRPVLLLVDLSPSLFFGSRRQLKSVLAGRLAALLGWAAVRAGNRLGGVVIAADQHREIPPAPREKGVMRLLQAMVALQPTAPGPVDGSALEAALSRLVRLTRPGSLVVLLSDFRGLTLGALPGQDTETAGDAASPHRQRHKIAADPPLEALTQHNDVILGFLYDPLEATPPPSGRYAVAVPEARSGLVPPSPLLLNLADATLFRHWVTQFQQHRTLISELCRRHSVHFMETSTDERPLTSLRRGLIRHGRQP